MIPDDFCDNPHAARTLYCAVERFCAAVAEFFREIWNERRSPLVSAVVTVWLLLAVYFVLAAWQGWPR